LTTHYPIPVKRYGALLMTSTGFDVFHVNPPLVRAIAGMPIALFCNPNYDWTGYSPRPQDRSEWRLGGAFVEKNELDDLRLYIFLMRLACIPLILLGSYFGYRFASELYGQWSGITFLVLWTFSPLILSWGATICPDVHAASLGIVGLYTFWRWLKTPTWNKAILAGICLGLMPLTKITWIIAFPIWLIIWSIWRFRKFRQFAKNTIVKHVRQARRSEHFRFLIQKGLTKDENSIEFREISP